MHAEGVTARRNDGRTPVMSATRCANRPSSRLTRCWGSRGYLLLWLCWILLGLCWFGTRRRKEALSGVSHQEAAHSLVLGSALAGPRPGPITLSGPAARQHLRLVGTTGSGKSKLLATLFLQRLNQGEGVALLDPHGDLCDDVLGALLDLGFYTDQQAFSRIWYVDLSRTDRSIAWNVLNQAYEPHTTARYLLESWKRAWSGLASGNAANLENLVLAGAYVLAIHRRPLTELPRLLADRDFREALLANCPDAQVVRFFHDRYDGLGRRAALLNESTLRRAFLLSFTPALRGPLSQHQNRLQFRALMDQGVSLLVNLGGLDTDTQKLLGCLFTVGIEEAALSRADVPEDQRPPYTLIIDEFSQFAAQSASALERVLAQTRKYHCSLVMAQQTLSQTGHQLEGAIQNAVEVVLRVGRADAAILTPRLFTPDLYRLKERRDMRPSYMSASDQRLEFEQALTTLAPREAYVRLGEQLIKFKTVGLPAPRASRQAVEAIKEEYARRLLTPAPPDDAGLLSQPAGRQQTVAAPRSAAGTSNREASERPSAIPATPWSQPGSTARRLRLVPLPRPEAADNDPS